LDALEKFGPRSEERFLSDCLAILEEINIFEDTQTQAFAYFGRPKEKGRRKLNDPGSSP
jgi:hypothetical protein